MSRKEKSKVGGKSPPKNNPVAKYAVINKAAVFRDLTQYRRNAKHRGRESFPIQAATNSRASGKVSIYASEKSLLDLSSPVTGKRGFPVAISDLPRRF